MCGAVRSLRLVSSFPPLRCRHADVPEPYVIAVTVLQNRKINMPILIDSISTDRQMTTAELARTEQNFLTNFAL